MTAHGLSLALEKTEVVTLTKKRIPTLRPISIGELTVESKSTVKYLGLMFDSKMSFLEQIKAADRTAAGVAALSHPMANVGGPISTAQTQRRGALRVASAYYTVSEPAVMVMAVLISVVLLAKERKAI